MNKRAAAIATSVILPAALLAGLDGFPAPMPKLGDRCPNCAKGKLVGTNGVRYCQRCAFTVKP